MPDPGFPKPHAPPSFPIAGTVASPASIENTGTSPRTEIAVVGVGAVGGCIAAHLSAAGKAVLLCVRHSIDALVVDTPSGVLRENPPSATDPREVQPMPWVLLATKAHQTPDAAAWLRALAGGESTIAVLQNGVEHEARVAPYAGRAVVLPVVVECPSTRTAPGRVTQNGPARLKVPAGERGEAFARLFAGSDVEVEVVERFEDARWRKLCQNVAGGAVSALTGRTLGVTREPGVAWLARELVLECVRVARAEGVPLDDGIADEIVTSLQEGDPGAGTSMLSDRLAGASLEVDARNGAVVRLGMRHDIPTPLNRAVTAVLLAVNGDR
ncbi:2-dehydropantoate 2-reductase [Longimicrobium terrae]|uniref:2-dehydropantoate 2-reductase n=1 Tax=Longimicrobium terrae TaxID=1639882 RepID=UPI0030B845C3